MLFHHRVQVKNILNLYISVLLKNNKKKKNSIAIWMMTIKVIMKKSTNFHFANGVWWVQQHIHHDDGVTCGQPRRHRVNCVICVRIHCKLLQGCPLPTPNPEVTPVSVSSVVQFYFLHVCFLCLDAGVCSGICVYFMTNANVYDPIMSARD